MLKILKHQTLNILNTAARAHHVTLSTVNKTTWMLVTISLFTLQSGLTVIIHNFCYRGRRSNHGSRTC